jgi:hypothetical protein
VIAAVLAVLLIAVVGWLAYSAGNDGNGGSGEEPRSGGTRTGTGGAGDGSGSPTGGSADPQVTADGMENFVEDYLVTVTSDPKAAWAMLTPAFQDASGGFGGYNSFWKSIESADLLSAEADPAGRQISYTVEYLRRDGTKTTDDVTLGLEGTDGEYLIAAES